MKKSLLFFSLIFLIINTKDIYAQCGTETFTVTDWCENQFAEWEITNPDPDARYHWYQLERNAGGTITNRLDYRYGANENGTHFVSPTRYTTPDPVPSIPEWDKRTFYYVKETGIQNFIPSGNLNSSIGDPTEKSDYSMTVNLALDIQLDYVSIPVVLYQLNSTYTIQIRIGTQYSEVFSFSGSSATPILGTGSNQRYLIKVPVGLYVEAGNHTIEVITNPASGTKEVDGLIWYNENAVTTSTFSQPGIVSATGNIKNVWGANRRSVISDWQFTSYCPIQEADPAFKTSVGCCIPVIGNVSISATEPTIVSGTDNTTLSIVSSVDAANNTFLWYKDGISLGHTGSTYSTNQAGVYSVREIANPSFANNISCYAEGLFEVQERALFVRLLSTPQVEYCVGDEIEIEAYGDITSLKWTPELLVQNPAAKTTKAILGVQTSSLNFIAEADIITDNRIKNGNFELGNQDFYTELGPYSGTTHPESGQFDIGTYVPSSQTFWSATTSGDITQQCRADGNFFYADGFGIDHGGGSTEGVVWRQAVTVTPSKEYTFSMDHANICWNGTAYDPRVAHADAKFRIYINGQLMLSTETDGQGEYEGVCRWKTDTFEWNSANNTTATIEIRQVREETGGRDYAIDNIFFGGPATQTAMISVGPIRDCFDLIAEAGDCDGDSVMLSAKAINTVTNEVVGIIDRWEREDDNTVIGQGSPIYVKPSTTTKYVAFGYFPASSIIVNGDFELGLNGFNYGFNKGLYDNGSHPGTFTVLANPTLTGCGAFCVNLGDHTSGSGQMLFVDPKTEDGDVISYDISAQIGKKYAFSLFVANAVNFVANPDGKASSISFIIENAGGTRETIASIVLERDNVWRELSSVWEAPADGNYQLIIHAVGDDNLPGSGGNDFVIDDIKLSTLIDIVYTDTVEVEPCINCLPGKITGNQEICYNTIPAGFSNAEAPETVEGTYTIEWQKSTDLLTWTPIASSNRLSYSETAALTADTYYRRKMSSAACTEYFSDTIKVTVASVVVPGSIEDNQTICAGSLPDPVTELTPASGGFDPIEYYWQRSYDNDKWEEIPAANNKDYIETVSLTDTTWYRRRIETGSCAQVTDINESVTGTALNQISYTGTWTNGSGLNKYLGTDRFSSAAGAGYSISFYGTELKLFSQQGADRGIFAVSVNGNPETMTDLYLDSPGNDQAAVYSTGRLPLDTHTVVVRVTGNAHAEATDAIVSLDRIQIISTRYSNVVRIAVQPEIDPGSIGQNDTICANSLPAPFTNLTAASGGNGTYTYQWQKSDDGLAWADISGASLATYAETTPLNDTTWYRRKVTAGVCPPQFSDSVQIVVISELIPSVSIEADQTTICENATVSFSIQNRGGGGTSPIYEWYRNNETTPLAATEDYHASNISDGDEFYLVLTSSEDCATPKTATSNKITINVELLPSEAAITQDDSSLCISAITLDATAPVSGTGTWSIRPGDAGTLQPNASANPVTVSGLEPGTTTRVYWTVSTGTECPSDIDSVDITRTGTLTAPDPGEDETICASVTTLQLNNNAAAGETATFSAEAPATVSASGLAGNFSPGENKFFLTLSNGFCEATEEIIITVIDVPAQPDPITGPSGIICADTENHVYSIDPVTDASSYDWSITGAGLSLQNPVDETSVRMDAGLTATNGVISVVAVNICGNSTPQTINVDVTPIIDPTVSIMADKTSLCADSIVNFTIATVGSEMTAPTYEWFVYRNGTDIATGETQPSVDLSNLQDKDSIYVKVTSDYACPGTGSANSVKTGLTVIPMKPVSVAITTDLNMPVCEGTAVTFTATPTNGGTSPVYEWRSGSTILGTTNPITLPLGTTTTVTVELTSNELCYANETATEALEYSIIPNVSIATILQPNNLTICKNSDSPVFTAGGLNHGNTPVYTWKLNGTVVKQSGDQTYTLATTSNLGVHIVEVIVESSEQCLTKQKDTVNTNIEIVDLPNLSITGPGRYCENQFVTLQATGALSYSWYRNSSSSASIGSSTSIPVASDGNYIVVGKDNNECTSADTLNVTVLAPRATIVSDRGFTECEGVTLTLSITETADSYTWSRNGVSLGTTQSIPVTEPGTYKIEVVVNDQVTCNASSEQAITFLPVPEPHLAYPDTLICEGEPLVYRVNNYGGTLQWFLNGEAISSSNRQLFSITESGTYYVLESNGYCQESSNSIQVTVEKVPVANAGSDLYIAPGETILLSGLASKDAHQYEWSSSSWIASIYEPEVTLVPEGKVSSYILTVSSPSGKCYSEDEIVVTIEYPVTAWNSFSPNGDGLYDTWIIENIDDYPDAVVEVYNRWGSLVFKSKGYNNAGNAWKGDNYKNGQLLPTATYYYIIYPNGGNVRKPITGDVTIVR